MKNAKQISNMSKPPTSKVIDFQKIEAKNTTKVKPPMMQEVKQ
jgi:hypothetical protein